MSILPYVFVAVVALLLIRSFWNLHRARVSRLLYPQSKITQAKEQLQAWQASLNELTVKEDRLWQDVLGGPDIPYLTDEEYKDQKIRQEYKERVADKNEAKLHFTIGLLCAIFLIPLVLVNCTVLGQVMELFVPPGAVPVVLPFVGWEMDPLALVFAIILAVCQAIFVLFFGITKGWAKVASGFLMVAAVAFETGGAYMRAKVIEEGMGGGGILAGQTALVSALIGFVAPVAVEISSHMAITKVFTPLLTLPGVVRRKYNLLFKIGYSTTSIIAQIDPQQGDQTILTPKQQARLEREQAKRQKQQELDNIKEEEAKAKRKKEEDDRIRREQEEILKRPPFILPEVVDASAKEQKLSETARVLVLKANALNAEIGKLAEQVAEMEQSQATNMVKDPQEALKHFEAALAAAINERILTTEAPPTPTCLEYGDQYPERLKSVFTTCEKLLKLLSDNVDSYLSKEMARTKLMLVPLHRIDSADSGILTWAKLRARLNILQSVLHTLKADHGSCVQEHQATINGLNQLVSDRRFSGGGGEDQPEGTAAILSERNRTANKRRIADLALRLGYGTMGQMALVNLRGLQSEGEEGSSADPTQAEQGIGQGSVFARLKETTDLLDGPIQMGLTTLNARLHGKVDVPRSCKVQQKCTPACPTCGNFEDQVERKYNDFVTLEVEPRRVIFEARLHQVETLIQKEKEANSKGSAWQRFLAGMRRMFGGGAASPQPASSRNPVRPTPTSDAARANSPVAETAPAKTTTIDNQGRFIIKDR